MSNTTQVNTNMTVDHITGEITEHYSVIQRAALNDEPTYIKLYIEQWIVTMTGKPSAASEVLLALISCGMTYANDNQVVYATAYNKQIVATKTGLNLRTVDNTIQKLVKIGALKRLARATYAVNPNLLGYGKWRDIKALQVNWTFSPSGITNETYVTGEPKTITGDDTLVVL